MAMKIDSLHKSIILELVKMKFPTTDTKSGRPIKCSNSDYLDAMFYVLKEGIGWDYLKGFAVKGNTVRQKFKKWSEAGIFKSAWVILVHLYKEFKIDFDDLFVDASHIKNYNGVDMVGKNLYDRFRKSTKLSIITDDIGTPISIKCCPGNVHDIKMVIDLLDNVPFEFDHYHTQYLIADKGYVGKELEKDILKKNYLKLITPTKRTKEQVKKDKERIKKLNSVKRKLNDKIKKNDMDNKILSKLPKYNRDKKKILENIKKNRRVIKELNKEKKRLEKKKKKRGRKTLKEKKLLKRFIVEHSFSWFKKYTRLRIRKDKFYTNFESFIFFGASNIVSCKLKNFLGKCVK